AKATPDASGSQPRRDPGHLDWLSFDNRFTRLLPDDPIRAPGSRQVPGAAFSRVEPAKAVRPRIVAWSTEVAAELGLGTDVMASAQGADVFTGNELLVGSDPHAMNYGGHQFGSWAGQLGDGRAIALGEVVDGGGGHYTLQLKGAGPTPYSRRADGLAVLRSSIREFLCSEAMHHLGVPTTRALSLAVTGSEVTRDILYDGHPRPEPGAIVCRVAPSFLRFGTYQLPASRGDIDLLRQLADFTIVNHFGHLGDPSPEVYVAWFDEVCRTSCTLVVEWMRVGFVHGVVNTDNMSIHGLTIDYGPYGWLDDFDLDWTPNTTDAGTRRYRYGYQPQVVQWNLLQLANAIYPLVGDADGFEAALNGFVDRYHRQYREMMLAKMGLVPSEEVRDDQLIEELVGVLGLTEIDMTIFFRRLADSASGQEHPLGDELGLIGPRGPLADAFYDRSALSGADEDRLVAWRRRDRDRVRDDARAPGERIAAMNRINPVYVLPNYLAQEAIDAGEQGSFAMVNELLEIVRNPYD
ncbi:MAG: YdiU family protein, partial [Actinomycetia bacterium]|nr:YdiU family protein [Actinomycetes bacterium]